MMIQVYCWPGGRANLPAPRDVTNPVAVKAYRLGFQSRLAAQIGRATGNPFGGAISELAQQVRDLWFDGWQDADDWLFIWRQSDPRF